MAYYGYGGFPKYVPVAERRARALKKMEKLRKKGQIITPIEPLGRGRKIATTFWGKGWCKHMESFSDYANRLPRGRSYVRNGSVCHLAIEKGLVKAIVTGSSLYNVTIKMQTLSAKKWEKIKAACTGQIGSLLDLLNGTLSDGVMSVVTERKTGLFPQPNEITLACDCPDWATMCKHVAAVLYGVAVRLDTAPKALFLLRGVDSEELIEVSTDAIDVTLEQGQERRVEDENELAELFGIEVGDAIIPVAEDIVTSATESQKPNKTKIKTRGKKASANALPRYYSGLWLKKLRQTLGLTQKTMAQKLLISPSTLSKYEKQDRKKVHFAREAVKKRVEKLWHQTKQ